MSREQSHRSIVALEADGETCCRSCSVPLIWAFNRDGDAVPLEREPDPQGTVGINRFDEWVFGLPRRQTGQLELLDEPVPIRYRLHYETCPDRDRWRKYAAAKRQREGGSK